MKTISIHVKTFISRGRNLDQVALCVKVLYKDWNRKFYLVYKLWREIRRTKKVQPISGSSEWLPPVGEGVQVERVEDDNEEAVSLEESELNERDKQVLEAIRAGNWTLSNIFRATGLPKTTAYRRVKKLVKLGLVREVREKGRVVYETNESGPTQS